MGQKLPMGPHTEIEFGRLLLAATRIGVDTACIKTRARCSPNPRCTYHEAVVRRNLEYSRFMSVTYSFVFFISRAAISIETKRAIRMAGKSVPRRPSKLASARVAKLAGRMSPYPTVVSVTKLK